MLWASSKTTRLSGKVAISFKSMHGQIMKTIIFFLPMEYRITAGNRLLYCIDVQVFGGKLVKNSFTRF